ncbi:MAG: SMC family ATPase [Anaerolineales bacterium]|nr:SMC family ATPase [Anaerolineales bacterium]
MIPIHLTISGFLSYRDPVEIDFTRFDLACIAGPNGAGKSSILDAITWALFNQGRKRDESLINLYSDTAEVVFVFDYEHNRYRVTRANPRGKPSLLEFHIQQKTANGTQPGALPGWKPLTEATLRATQERIEETLRLDYETFVNAAFFLQGKADQFTQQRPADRKRILASILGLEAWDGYRQRAATQRREVEAEITALDGRLAEINAELSEEQVRKTRLTELEGELESLNQARGAQERALDQIRQAAAALAEQEKLVTSLGRQLETAAGRLQTTRERLASRQAEKVAYAKLLERAPAIEEARQQLLAGRAELEQWNQVAEQFREHEKRRQEPLTQIESQRARLQQELANLEQQQAALSEQQAGQPVLEQELNARQARLHELEVALQQRQELEASLTTAQAELANARAENPRLKAEMDDLKERIDQLQQAEGADCPLCGQPLSLPQRQDLIASLTAAGTAMGDQYRANRQLLSEADARVNGLKAEINAVRSLDEELRSATRQFDQLQSNLAQVREAWQTWERQGAVRLAEVRQLLAGENFAPQARTQLAEVDAELQAIGYAATEHDRVRRQLAELSHAEADFHALEKGRAALAPLEDEIANLEAQVADLQQEFALQRQEYDQASAALTAAKVEEPDVQQAQLDLLAVQERENRLRMEVGAARQKVSVLADLKARRQELEAQREQLATQVSRYKQLEKAFGKDGVPALLIEQALPQIETKANEILSRLSDDSMTVRFSTQRELKTREDLKETLDILISDSAGSRDYEMFSGGEAFRVNFAIRLALSEVLAQRAGARLQTLVIDEGFGSQDALGRQRLVEAINLVRDDFAKILVITHIEALKDAFPHRIEVEKTGRGSQVRVI